MAKQWTYGYLLHRYAIVHVSIWVGGRWVLCVPVYEGGRETVYGNSVCEGVCVSGWGGGVLGV